MTARTSAGSTLAIAAAQPATYNEAGYDALTPTLIGEITDLGEFGRVYNVVTHNPLDTRATVKRKGSYNEGTMELKLALDGEDAGQDLLEAASISDNDYSFELTLQDGTRFFFQAQVSSFKIGVGTVDQITGASVTLELTSNDAGVGIIRVDPES
jgi:hypothetical protein